MQPASNVAGLTQLIFARLAAASRSSTARWWQSRKFVRAVGNKRGVFSRRLILPAHTYQARPVSIVISTRASAPLNVEPDIGASSSSFKNCILYRPRARPHRFKSKAFQFLTIAPCDGCIAGCLMGLPLPCGQRGTNNKFRAGGRVFVSRSQ
jgi:hypothetical protein